MLFCRPDMSPLYPHGTRVGGRWVWGVYVCVATRGVYSNDEGAVHVVEQWKYFFTLVGTEHCNVKNF